MRRFLWTVCLLVMTAHAMQENNNAIHDAIALSIIRSVAAAKETYVKGWCDGNDIHRTLHSHLSPLVLRLVHDRGWKALNILVYMRKIPIDLPLEQGKRLLHYAVEQQDVMSVHNLLKKGANPNAQDSNGFCPEEYNIIPNNSVITQLFTDYSLQHPDRYSYPLAYSCDELRYYLEKLGFDA